MPKVAEVLENNIKLILIVTGVVLLLVANSFQAVVLKVQIDRLLAEVGALVLVIGLLHFLFEIRLRKEMLRDVSVAVLGNEHLHNCGFDDCLMDSRQVNESSHWENAGALTIGVQYSPKFFEDFHALLRRRCAAGRETIALALRPGSPAANYLRDSQTGLAKVKDGVERIASLLQEAAKETKGSARLLYHDRVLRYSFIRTEEAIWVKFFTNSKDRAQVPAVRLRAGTDLYRFVSDDIDRMITAAAT